MRTGVATKQDYDIIDEWRMAHRFVINTFQGMLRPRARGKEIAVAQRHKRRRTIFDKLFRVPGMQLARMNDVAGCRIIFETVEDLYEFRTEFLSAKFYHETRNDENKYDYIKIPKVDGYRGIHDIFEYKSKQGRNSNIDGLFIEVQYRTRLQHSWATAVEIIGLITESQPKFGRGDPKIMQAMALASEILARSFENRTGPFPLKDSASVVAEFISLDKELGLIERLANLNLAEDIVLREKNTILIFKKDGTLDAKTYRDSSDATSALYKLEKSQPEDDIVLVRADSKLDVRLAYKNYFRDAKDFVESIGKGMRNLRSQGIKPMPPK